MYVAPYGAWIELVRVRERVGFAGLLGREGKALHDHVDDAFGRRRDLVLLRPVDQVLIGVVSAASARWTSCSESAHASWIVAPICRRRNPTTCWNPR